MKRTTSKQHNKNSFLVIALALSVVFGAWSIHKSMTSGNNKKSRTTLQTKNSISTAKLHTTTLIANPNPSATSVLTTKIVDMNVSTNSVKVSPAAISAFIDQENQKIQARADLIEPTEEEKLHESIINQWVSAKEEQEYLENQQSLDPASKALITVVAIDPDQGYQFPRPENEGHQLPPSKSQEF